ncbi:T9SS type A sorting domain-containing protein, partial [Chryseobacterium sp.]|uniref:T9SS type A sorting domain-containing protein n=1 Tax=Chryseobacterium sp. TaxID=1871047 RepID=UPI0032193AFD
FDAYNLTNNIKLPTGSTDTANKANLVIEKYSGSSVANTGTISSFGSSAMTINPNIEDIVWNETYQYWEVSFLTVGFGGYFVKARSGVLGTENTKLNSGITVTPNPAKDFVNVRLGKYTKGLVTIYDASGKLIRTVNMKNSENKIDVSALVKGLYLFTITLDDNIKITKKVVKE